MAMENAPMKNWELTLYELQRKPQQPITDGTEIAVSPRSLQSELKCPICLDILKDTMTTKECLHRFCAECIVTALRSGNKECPTCRKKLISKRSLRRDPNFDALIAKIYPSRKEFEAQQEKVLAKFNKQHNHHQIHEDLNNRRQLESLNIGGNGTVAESVMSEDDATSMAVSLNQHHSRVDSDAESGIETNSVGGTSSICASDSTRVSGTSAGPRSNHLDSSNATVPVSNQPTLVTEIELLLKPYPRQGCANLRRSELNFYPSDHEDELKTSNSSTCGHSDVNDDTVFYPTPSVKYLKAPSITTIDHLSRYLGIRLNLQTISKNATNCNVVFSLYYYNESTNDYVHLQPSATIEEISLTYWNELHNLDLYYMRESSTEYEADLNGGKVAALPSTDEK